jgi:hypothetical protein
MAKIYRPHVPEQDLLLPPSLRERLPENHLAFFVCDLIDQLDLSAITSAYEDEERGYPPPHPAMLTKVSVYGYLRRGLFVAEDRAAVGRRCGVHLHCRAARQSRGKPQQTLGHVRSHGAAP